MEKHIKVLGVLFIAYHAVGLLIGFFVLSLLSGMGLASHDPEAAGVMVLMGVVAGTALLVLSLPGIVAGIGLLKRKEWARILALIVGFFNLINIPLGTALGAYTFWVLLQDETVRIFRSGRPTPAA